MIKQCANNSNNLTKLPILSLFAANNLKIPIFEYCGRSGGVVILQCQ